MTHYISLMTIISSYFASTQILHLVFFLNVSNLNNKANIISSFYYITVRHLCLPKV